MIRIFYEYESLGGGGVIPTKPYFTKYLPVEGEIKEGETGISINNATYTHYNHLGKDYGKPAKLFLCSRDIQVRDKLQTISGVKTQVEYPSQLENFPYDKLFKVIGEISPEATWVKEGNEFDEDDWQFVVYEIDARIELPKYPIPRFANLEIKGPCGHFH